VTNFAHGRQAEQAAAEYLIAQGYKILEQNWRTRYCEIDIVASKDKTIYFVEVKYRQSNNQGEGFDYITPKKLEQMNFAAEMWLGNNNWSGDCCLSAIELTGPNFVISEHITDL
jgi:uncharacterized protein (TIGR00252 family)